MSPEAVDLDEMYEQLENSFRNALQPAIEEARSKEMPRLAEALRGMRDLMLAQSPEAVRAQLQRFGIQTFTPDQARALVAVAGQEMARQVIDQAKAQQQSVATRIWQLRSARYTVIAGAILGALSLLFTGLDNFIVFLGRLHG